MRATVADQLEAFVEAGALWDDDAGAAMVAFLTSESETTGDVRAFPPPQLPALPSWPVER